MKLKPKKNLKLFNRKELDHIPTPAEIKAANDIYMAKLNSDAYSPRKNEVLLYFRIKFKEMDKYIACNLKMKDFQNTLIMKELFQNLYFQLYEKIISKRNS